MAKIIDGTPTLICSSCLCKFEYGRSDVEEKVEQYWAGIWKAWQSRAVRSVVCPGCGKRIILK